MARFIVDTFNTGTITAGNSATFHRTITANKINVGKIKIVPSGLTTGFVFEIFKKDTCLNADRQYGTKDPTQRNPFFEPTNRSGGEVLEGFIIPYEDLDETLELHIKVTNKDSVSRNYDVTIHYEDYDIVAVTDFKSVDLSGQLPESNIVLPHTPATFLGLWRGGLLQYEDAAGDYTRSGANITLAIPGVAGERLWAMYVIS